jgi:LCP family protein required for cell wall assembly
MVGAPGSVWGRHASARGEGFGALLALTALGAVVPGSGLVVSGLRRTGWAVVAVSVAVGATLGWLLVSGDMASLGLRLATRPGALLAVAVAAPAVALTWGAVIVVGHVRLRRTPLTAAQQAVSALVVAALVTVVVVPGAVATRYATAQRSLVLTVFDEPETERTVRLHFRPADQPADELAVPDVEARDPWAGTPRINVLLLGTDAGDDRKGTRADTMIVASIATHTGDTVLFGLPRNLAGPRFAEGTAAARQFPRGFYPGGRGCPASDCLLNAVWNWAEANAHLFPGVDEPGLVATRDAVSGTLALPIDYYAVVNLQGFVDVVDAIGGVRIDVERRLPIGGIDAEGNSVEPSGYIQPGEQLLDGFTALWYARSRAGSDDYDRMRRQRCTIAAVVHQAEPARLARAFPRLAASAQRNVETDIRASELDAFVELARRVQHGTLRSLPFTNEVVDTGHPDYAAIRALVRQAVAPPQAAPAAARPPATAGTVATALPPPDQSPDRSTAPAAAQSSAPPAPDPSTPVDVEDVCG